MFPLAFGMPNLAAYHKLINFGHFCWALLKFVLKIFGETNYLSVLRASNGTFFSCRLVTWEEPPCRNQWQREWSKVEEFSAALPHWMHMWELRLSVFPCVCLSLCGLSALTHLLQPPRFCDLHTMILQHLEI